MRRLVFIGFVLSALASCGNEVAELQTPIPFSFGNAGNGGGSGSSGGNGDTGAGTGMPCDVATALGHACTTCHGPTPKQMAPMSMVTRDDLLAKSPVDATQTIAQRALTRMNDNVTSMPPTSFAPRASGADRTALANWITAGYPSGTCMTADLPAQTGTGGGTTQTGAGGGSTTHTGGGSGGGAGSTGGGSGTGGGGTHTGGGSGGGGTGSTGGGTTQTGSGGGGGSGIYTGLCDNPNTDCIDASGFGDYECVDFNTSSGFPSGAQTCVDSTDCPDYYTCFTSGSHSKCLQDCDGF